MVRLVAKLFCFHIIKRLNLINYSVPDGNLKIYSVNLNFGFQIIFGIVFLRTILIFADYYYFNMEFANFYYLEISNFNNYFLDFENFITSIE
jgi:hypothetical protein